MIREVHTGRRIKDLQDAEPIAAEQFDSFLFPLDVPQEDSTCNISGRALKMFLGSNGGGGLTEDVLRALNTKYNKTGGTISGNAVVDGCLNVNDKATFGDSVEIANEIVTGGNASIIGNASIGGNLHVEKSATILENGAIGGHLDVQHTATASQVIARQDVTAGRNIQTAEFAGGPTGTGARIDQGGNGELHSLVLRMFLETPELRKNKISVIGDEFWVTAAGLIESVTESSSLPVYTKDGRKIIGQDGRPWRVKVGAGYVLRFKLEPGDVHTFKKDDILVSKFDQSEGFQTAWFRVKYMLSEREVFVTACNGYAPQVAMSVARQGNFTDPERQNSIYIDGRNGYIRVLSGVNSTEIRFENIRCQYGNLNGLAVPNIGSLHGYGEYSDNAYKRGVFVMQGGKRVEDFVREAVEALQSSLGGLAFEDKVEKALLGNTIISGGFIKSELIAVDDALVGRLIASDAFITKLTTSEAFIDRLVARAVSTQQGNNPQRVELNRGDGAVRVINADGETTLNINSGERLGPNSWTNGGIYMSQRMDGSLRQCHVGADEIEFKRQGYDIQTAVDFNGMTINSTLNGVKKQALYYANGIDLPSGAIIDMPGVLAAGRARAQGGVGYLWGCKSAGIGVSTKVGGVAGKYRINHYLGHTNYSTTVTAAGHYSNWEVSPVIVAETDNYVEVWMLDNSVPREVDFNFVIIGDKKKTAF